MTEKVKKTWYNLNDKVKISIIVTLVLSLLVPLVALAASGISFSGYSPGNGTTTGNPKPAIKVTATPSGGTISESDVKMYLNGKSVTPTLSASSNNYTISHAPAEKLSDSAHSVKVEVYDSTKGSYEPTETWNFTVDAIPNSSKWTPAKGSTNVASNTNISLYVKDNYDSLDSSSAKMALDGNPVSATFENDGYWDYYGWISDSKAGTISYKPTSLKDGPHTVVATMSDVNGNELSETWNFTVKEGPKFASLTPAANSESTSVKEVSAVISDNDAVDWTTVKLLINDKAVTPTIDKATGKVSYLQDFASDKYKVYLEAKDVNGNLSSKTWYFIADSAPPELAYLYDFKDGMTINDGKLKLRAKLTDLVDIKDNVTLALNGNLLKINFRYEGYEDYYGNYIVTSKKTAYIDYEGTVANGNHTLALYSEDKFANKITRNWTFTVSTKPSITERTPLKYGVQDLTPTISAVVKSPNDTVESSQIELKVNGAIVSTTFDPTTGKVTYTPTTSFVNEAYHTVSLTVTDSTGDSTNSTWKFYTNNYPDMSDSNISNCTACHTINTFTGSNGDFESIHNPNLGFAGTHSANQCANCHNYVSVADGCSQCHGDPLPEKSYEYAPHGSTPAIKYTATNFNQDFPLRITTNREMWDCIVCHQPGAETKGYQNFESTPTRLLNNHDIPELHKTTTTNFDTDCLKCHAKSMTREHARDGRVDSNGKAMTCKTCHESTDIKVKAAITNKKKACSDCHTDVSHESLHTYTNLKGCDSCHSNILSKEHNSDKQMDCNTCHQSTKPSVKRAINFKQLACSDCHEGGGHGIKFEKSVPEILKFSPSDGTKLEWMNPETLDYWTGESWVPQGFETGMLIWTKRDPSISGTEVYNFYKNQLSKLGWSKVSAPDSASNKFELEYAKDNTKLIVRFYNTVTYKSDTLSSGYRIEIMYK